MYYKVVNNNLTSAYVGSTWIDRKELIVQYKIGKWVYPNINGTDLMVFSSLDDAKHFLNDCGWRTKIFKCEVKNPRKTGLFILQAYVPYILRAVKLRLKHKKFMDVVNKPAIPGTIFCKAVKLLEEVTLRF